MNIYHDWEFIDTGDRILPLSVGMVAEDDRELYMIYPAHITEALKHPWLVNNVLSHFPIIKKGGQSWEWDWEHPEILNVVKDRGFFRAHISNFVRDTPNPDLWAWYSAYDHVCLAQTFGRMLDLPDHVPMQTDDLKTLAKQKGNPGIPAQSDRPHHALADARHDRAIHKFLESI